MRRITDTEARRLLGVAAGASSSDVRTAFAAAVRAAHPDTGTGPAHPDVGALIAARDTLLSRPSARRQQPTTEPAESGPVAPVSLYRRHALTPLARWWHRRRARHRRARH